MLIGIWGFVDDMMVEAITIPPVDDLPTGEQIDDVAFSFDIGRAYDQTEPEFVLEDGRDMHFAHDARDGLVTLPTDTHLIRSVGFVQKSAHLFNVFTGVAYQESTVFVAIYGEDAAIPFWHIHDQASPSNGHRRFSNDDGPPICCIDGHCWQATLICSLANSWARSIACVIRLPVSQRVTVLELPSPSALPVVASQAFLGCFRSIGANRWPPIALDHLADSRVRGIACASLGRDSNFEVMCDVVASSLSHRFCRRYVGLLYVYRTVVHRYQSLIVAYDFSRDQGCEQTAPCAHTGFC